MIELNSLFRIPNFAQTVSFNIADNKFRMSIQLLTYSNISIRQHYSISYISCTHCTPGKTLLPTCQRIHVTFLVRRNLNIKIGVIISQIPDTRFYSFDFFYRWCQCIKSIFVKRIPTRTYSNKLYYLILRQKRYQSFEIIDIRIHFGQNYINVCSQMKVNHSSPLDSISSL